jgi:hypothetical protein
MNNKLANVVMLLVLSLLLAANAYFAVAISGLVTASNAMTDRVEEVAVSQMAEWEQLVSKRIADLELAKKAALDELDKKLTRVEMKIRGVSNDLGSIEMLIRNLD